VLPDNEAVNGTLLYIFARLDSFPYNLSYAGNFKYYYGGYGWSSDFLGGACGGQQ